MASEKFSLCWNNFHSNLSSGFHSLFQGEHLVDVTLAAEGRILKAHKIVLSVCSPYFSELFRVNPCTHPIVILKDVSASALDQLLTFMYCGEVSVRQDELGTFIKTAEALQIKGLTGHSSSSTQHESQLNGVSNVLIDDISKSTKDIETPQSQSSSISNKKRQRSKHIPIQPAPLPTFSKSKISRVEKKSSKITSVRQSTSIDSSEDIDEIIAKKTCIGPVSPDKMEDEPIVLPVETEMHDTITPKIEPVDDFDSYDTSQYSDDTAENSMDATALLETKVSYGTSELAPSEVSLDEWSLGKSKLHRKSDTPSLPGSSTSQKEPLRFLTSAKGLPVLVYAGHIYTFDESKNNKTTWVCVKRNKLNCHGCVTTTIPSTVASPDGNSKDSVGSGGKGKLKNIQSDSKEEKTDSNLIVSSKIVSYCGHNHSQLNDIIDRIQAKDSVCVTPKI